MAIVFSAITPHAPILIPSIGKENLNQLTKTAKAFKLLEENLYASKTETLIIISPHGVIYNESFAMNLNPEFNLNFEDFGDFSSKLSLQGDIGLAYQIRESLETEAPLQLISEPNLDHGCGVPLYLLTQHMKNLKILPIYFSGLDLESHFEFGKLLKRKAHQSNKRVGIIASGDLSHRLTKDAPAGYSPKGAKFDQRLTEYIRERKTKELLEMDSELINEAGECGLRSIAILLGAINSLEYEPEILAYENPFGVGYLTVNFKL